MRFSHFVGATAALAVLACALLATPASGASPSRFATSVVSYNPGPGASLTDPTRALGGPRGAGGGSGSLDVVSLGVDGTLTLGFDVTIADGPGADLVVSENGFFVGPDVFSEVMFVEVSTDGVTFARFPNNYGLPPGSLPPFGGAPIGAYRGLAGGIPVFANVDTNTIDPFNPVESGGEAFDLVELANDPAVLSGAVDLNAIHFVRLHDVVAGSSDDSDGDKIYDNGGDNGNADLDSVAVIHYVGEPGSSRPVVDLSFDAAGFLVMEFADPDGIGDFKPSTIRASVSTVEFPFAALLPAFKVDVATSTRVVLKSIVPLTGTGFLASFAVSAQDYAGLQAADEVIVQG
jgi:hypothetical protein